MASLYFHYSTMNAGKSTQLLQVNFNYIERGMRCLLLTPSVDDRYGKKRITSRIGISAEAKTFNPQDNLLDKYIIDASRDGMDAVLIDEAQFATPNQVWEMAVAVDKLNIPVLAFGLRTDFQGKLFPGSAALFEIADELRELRTVCHCGKRATMVLRKDKNGKPTFKGEQVQIGGNDTYVALCRRHWAEALDFSTSPPP